MKYFGKRSNWFYRNWCLQIVLIIHCCFSSRGDMALVVSYFVLKKVFYFVG